MIRLRIINIELQRSAFMSLNQSEKIFRLMQNRISSDDVVRVGPESGRLCGAVRLDVQDVPDVFIGAFERAEADGDAQKALAAPKGAWGYEDLTYL